jgi:hypothetical protein
VFSKPEVGALLVEPVLAGEVDDLVTLLELLDADCALGLAVGLVKHRLVDRLLLKLVDGVLGRRRCSVGLGVLLHHGGDDPVQRLLGVNRVAHLPVARRNQHAQQLTEASGQVGGVGATAAVVYIVVAGSGGGTLRGGHASEKVTKHTGGLISWSPDRDHGDSRPKGSPLDVGAEDVRVEVIIVLAALGRRATTGAGSAAGVEVDGSCGDGEGGEAGARP